MDAAEREGTASVGALAQVGVKVERGSACPHGEGMGRRRAHRPSCGKLRMS